jgi:hypothetical protein
MLFLRIGKSFDNLPRQLVGANFFVASLFLFTILISSCNKTTSIGAEVLPDSNSTGIVDTITLITQTQAAAPLATDETSAQAVSTDILLGTYVDPVFGKTKASLYTQLGLSVGSSNFGTNPLIDSVVLSLVYDASVYGKTPLVQQNISVYRLSADLDVNNTYYAHDTISTLATDLASAFAFVPAPTAPVNINGVSLLPQLRVPLDANIGQEILNRPSSDLASNTAFQSYLKGLYITTKNTSGLSSGEGNILRFKMADAETKLTLYYHNSDTTALQTYSLPLNSGAYFSQFKHDYAAANADFVSQINSTSSTQNKTVFLQPGATRIKITAPYINRLLDSSGIIVNKAELIFRVNDASEYQTDIFTVPEKILVYGINTDGSTYQLPDEQEGTLYYDGNFNTTTKQYTVNIARYVQQILDGKLSNNGLYLVPVYETINPNRLVIGGGSSLDNTYQMKLRITYTRLP